MRKTIWNRFLVSFLNGIAILLPVAITVAIIRFCVIKLNQIVLTPLLRFIDPGIAVEQRMFLARTIIFIGVILWVALIGWGAKILVINRFFSLGENVLLNVPIIGRVYKSVKQISSAFIGHGKTIFKQVVLVEYPRKGIYSLGFTTGVTKGEIKDAMGKSSVNVFLPTTPNPTSGYFLVIPKDEIRFLEMSVEEGMKLVVSGGSVSPQYFAEKAEEGIVE
ncbi:MAG: DUF502 domain-containing protein [Candidatus Omnitrophota bacterium]|jgi:uncharacterized membrane protein